MGASPGVRRASPGRARARRGARRGAGRAPGHSGRRCRRLPSRHWVVVSDFVLQRSAFVDLDAGQPSSAWSAPATACRRRPGRAAAPSSTCPRPTTRAAAAASAATWSRVYDEVTLAPVAEIEIPPKRAINTLATGNVALSDDDRFLAVFNMTPATSLSIVDVQARALRGRDRDARLQPGLRRRPAPLPDAVRRRRAAARRARRGRPRAQLERSAPFFDPAARSRHREGGARRRALALRLLRGQVHEVDLAGGRAALRRAVAAGRGRRRRAGGWRIGGSPAPGAAPPTRRLFALMHQGGPDSHKDAGSELWVYDLAQRQRVQRIEVRHPGFEILGESLAFGQRLAVAVRRSLRLAARSRRAEPRGRPRGGHAGRAAAARHQQRARRLARDLRRASGRVPAPRRLGQPLAVRARGSRSDGRRDERFGARSRAPARCCAPAWRCCSPLAAAHKLRAPRAFAAQLAAYRLLPDAAALPAARSRWPRPSSPPRWRSARRLSRAPARSARPRCSALRRRDRR